MRDWTRGRFLRSDPETAATTNRALRNIWSSLPKSPLSRTDDGLSPSAGRARLAEPEPIGNHLLPRIVRCKIADYVNQGSWRWQPTGSGSASLALSALGLNKSRCYDCVAGSAISCETPSAKARNLGVLG